MSKTDDLRAELALAELEERLVGAKAGAAFYPELVDDDEYRALKNQVRAARQAHREAREG